jgi:hypothetical protein
VWLFIWIARPPVSPEVVPLVGCLALRRFILNNISYKYTENVQRLYSNIFSVWKDTRHRVNDIWKEWKQERGWRGWELKSISKQWETFKKIWPHTQTSPVRTNSLFGSNKCGLWLESLPLVHWLELTNIGYKCKYQDLGKHHEDLVSNIGSTQMPALLNPGICPGSSIAWTSANLLT